MTEPAELPQLRTPDQHAEGGLEVPDDVQVLEGTPSGGRRGVAVVVSRFNGEITSQLLTSALEELDRAGVAREAVTVVPVPGAFELPLATLALAKTRRFSCVIALGCVIRGETYHFEIVANESARGLMDLMVRDGLCIGNGILTVEDEAQALHRARANELDKGGDAARACLALIALKRRFTSKS